MTLSARLGSQNAAGGHFCSSIGRFNVGIEIAPKHLMDTSSDEPREVSESAAGIATRLIRDLQKSDHGSSCMRVRLTGETWLVAVLIDDASGPPRLLFGPHGPDRLDSPHRIEIDTVAADRVTRAIEAALDRFGVSASQGRYAGVEFGLPAFGERPRRRTEPESLNGSARDDGPEAPIIR